MKQYDMAKCYISIANNSLKIASNDDTRGSSDGHYLPTYMANEPQPWRLEKMTNTCTKCGRESSSQSFECDCDVPIFNRQMPIIGDTYKGTFSTNALVVDGVGNTVPVYEVNPGRYKIIGDKVVIHIKRRHPIWFKIYEYFKKIQNILRRPII